MTLKNTILATVMATTFSYASYAAPTFSVSAGKTKVALSSGFTDALGSLGVTPSVANDAQLKETNLIFPAVGGAVDVSNASGEILHTGNLVLTAGDTTVSLGSFIIDTTGDAPILTGLVSANDSIVGRLPLFNLELPQISLPLEAEESHSSKTLEVPNVLVNLTSDAANALNGTFGLTGNSALPEGVNIGTATVKIRDKMQQGGSNNTASQKPMNKANSTKTSNNTYSNTVEIPNTTSNVVPMTNQTVTTENQNSSSSSSSSTQSNSGDSTNITGRIRNIFQSILYRLFG